MIKGASVSLFRHFKSLSSRSYSRAKTIIYSQTSSQN